MSIFDFSKPPEEDKQPSFEPKRVIHRSKPLPHTGGGNRQRASIFRRKPASPPAAKSQPEVTPAAQPETRAEYATSESIPPRGGQTVPARTGKGINPGLRLRALETAGKNAPPLILQSESRPLSRGERTRRAYWDVTAGFSLIVNAILLAILLIMAIQINNLKTTVNGLLSGLYDNFVSMDNSTISTTINVQDMPIPLDFSLPVVQDETNVTLTRAVTIQGARVTIYSGALTIDNALATVTLPVGTTLPVSLNMTVPVQTTVLVDMQVPVNITLSQSNPPGDGQVGLHDAFWGLQNTVGPFYCLFEQDLLDATGGLVCQQGTYYPRIINP